MKAELRQLLLAAASHTAAIAGERVDWGVRPEGDPVPAVRLVCVDDPDDYTLGGSSGLSDAYVTAECWAESYADADALANAVRLDLSGLKSGIFRGIFVAGGRDGSEYTPAATFHCISLDLRVWRQTA